MFLLPTVFSNFCCLAQPVPSNWSSCLPIIISRRTWSPSAHQHTTPTSPHSFCGCNYCSSWFHPTPVPLSASTFTFFSNFYLYSHDTAFFSGCGLILLISFIVIFFFLLPVSHSLSNSLFSGSVQPLHRNCFFKNH